MTFIRSTFFVLLVVLVTDHAESHETPSRNKRDGYVDLRRHGDDYRGPPTQFKAARVKAGSMAEILYYNNGWLTSTHRAFAICNIGLHPFEAIGVYGSGVTSWTTYISRIYEPGLNKSIPMDGNFYMTELQVKADKSGTGLVYAHRGFLPDGYLSYTLPSPYTINISGMQVIGMLASKVLPKYVADPVSSIVLSMVIDIFFKNIIAEKEDPWKEIEKKVDEKIEASQAVIISTILDSDLRPIREQIVRIQRLVNTSKINDRILYHLESTATIEFKFTFPSNKKLNYHVLPLYSQAVNMKLAFIAWCLRFADKLGLDEDDIESIKDDRDIVVDNAVSHVYSMYAERDKFAYENCDMDSLYNCVMEIRTHITIYGLDYVAMWQALKRESEPEVIVPTTVSYSNFFGRATANLFKQLFADFGKPPLTPELIDKTTRARLVKIVVLQNAYSWIYGIKQIFDNGKEYVLGNPDETYSHSVDLSDVRLVKLTVKGTRGVYLIGFHLSDGREVWHGSHMQVYGRKRYDAVFELKDHYISSLYVANDHSSRQGFGVILNIACSYMIIPELASGQNLVPDEALSQEKK